MNDLNEITKNCERFTTCAQVELLGDKPRNVKVRMRRISENVGRADFKFLVVCFLECSMVQKSIEMVDETANLTVPSSFINCHFHTIHELALFDDSLCMITLYVAYIICKCMFYR